MRPIGWFLLTLSGWACSIERSVHSFGVMSNPAGVTSASHGRVGRSAAPDERRDRHDQDAEEAWWNALPGDRGRASPYHPQCTVSAAVVKRVALWAFVAFAVFFVAYSPNSAASVARWLGRTLVGVANGFGQFFAGLVS
jgi:hypothetical protein